MPQLVNVQLDIMKLPTKPIVKNVVINVSIVSILAVTVLNVKLTEPNLHQNVHVHLELLTLTVSVLLVIGIVLNVLKLPEIVLLVLKTESKPQLVCVQMVPTKFLTKLFVHHVLINVTNVSLVLTIVPLVLLEELTHQNVLSHHQKLHLLKLLMFQSVLLKLLTVHSNVKLVLKFLTIVNSVILTELTHLLVIVSMNSIPIQLLKNVLLVTLDVLIVLLFLMMIIQIVKITVVPVTELLLQTVHVQLVLMKTILKKIPLV